MEHASTTAMVASVAATLLTILAIVGWATRRVDDPATIERWARHRGVAITEHNRWLVRWYVPLAGTLRVVGAVSGAVVGSLADRALGMSTSVGAGFWMWVVVGWVSGGWWAAEQVARWLPSGGGALLVPRATADYAPGAARWGPAVGAVAVAAVTVAGALVTQPSGWTAIAGIVAVVAPLAERRAARRTIDRRQPAVHPDLLAADDAIRSTTVHLLGAGTTAGLLLAAAALWSTTIADHHQLPFGLRGWPTIVLLLGGYVAGRYLANRPWRVRRTTIARSAS
ncbi:MAG: hypothetical protein KDB04_04155 [Acidimicrobiales bacterium]|nr:hypothetical protein [Acidimicrobiales bacterium]HRW36965.1 hypothetical protein [Aquihabitans sp.]